MARVTKTERNRAKRQARETARFERKSSEAATRLGFRMQSRVLRAFRQGDLVSISKIVEEEFRRVRPVMAEAMTIAYLVGLDRLKEVGTQTVAAAIGAPVHRGAIKFYFDRLAIDPARLREIQKAQEAQSVLMLTRMEDGVNRGLQRAMLRANQEGLTTREGTKAMRQAFANLGITPVNPFEFETQFRTQTQLAYSAGTWDAAHDPVVDEILWGYKYVTVGDDRVRPEHAALDGVTARKNDPVWDSIWPPNGWNSVPPETPVLTEQGWKPIVTIRHGEKVATHEGRFRSVKELHCHEGPRELVMIHLDRAGIVPLALTGNHRVMTDRGWVEASRLKVGDDVLHAVDVSISDEARWNVDDIRQAEIVYDRDMARQYRPGLMALQLDADLEIGQIEVEPISTGALIEDMRDRTSFEDSRKDRLVFAHGRGGVRMRRRIASESFDPRFRHLLTNFRSPGRRGDLQGFRSPSGMVGIPLVFEDDSFASAPHLDSVESEQASNRSELNSGGVSNHLAVAPPVAVVAEKSGHPSAPSVVDPVLCPVVPHAHDTIVPLRFSKIKRVSRVANRSKVYNLAVEEDDSYIAAGIAIHNCRCQVIFIFESETTVLPGPVDVDGRTIIGGPDKGFAFNPGTVLSKGSGARKPGAVGEKVLKKKAPWVKKPAPKVAPAEKISQEKLSTIIDNETELIKNAKLENVRIVDSDTGEIVLKKRGTSDAISFTDSELKEMKGRISVHNHPGKALNFSTDDIRFLSHHGLQETRVITKNRLFKMSRIEGKKVASPTKIRSLFNKRTKEIAPDIAKKYRNAKLTLDQAGGIMIHETWKSIAKEIGLKYTRVVL